MIKKEGKRDVIYGVNPVLEALRAGREIERIILARGRGGTEATEIVNLARERDINISIEPKEALNRMACVRSHQGVVAVVSAGRYATLDEIMERAKASGEPPFILILDGIQDPQNLGAIIRSAVCTGVHGIIIPKDRAVGLTAAVEKASAGALEYMAVARVTNISQTIQRLKKEGLWIAGAIINAIIDIYSCDLKIPIGIVIGAEEEGIRPLVAHNCDLLVSIPMKGKISSLNASAAAAVFMYEVVRQRGGSEIPYRQRR